MALHATSSRDSVRAAAEGEPEWAGDASRRPAAFYSAVFAQVRQLLDEMPQPGGVTLRRSCV
jgi:hypothetical protein